MEVCIERYFVRESTGKEWALSVGLPYYRDGWMVVGLSGKRLRLWGVPLPCWRFRVKAIKG